ncbi:class I SAM-dependent methyltransferase [Antarcticibacterium flavum]|uniref:Class I SAM-dependent methyltransferase n=1 Tax=Antarcticibacterium flavum TaxID=2058175 RepID=A0A5B7X5F6_9FLAO|nr:MULTISPECIES: class I SAM-dependent methyltransferase [Antarcticibacterium]MCM4161386.1 methyltransferase [Antarcticibacterium sp. W02-3]QCY70589.1 class I SAM-dependent methyltransferase [Antarcticibacterium flavum]
MSSKKGLDINKKQQEFYENKKKNFATRIWSFFRNGTLNKIKKEIGVEQDIYNLHVSWFGDLSKKKVLDLGCYEGNSLTYYLAEKSLSYLGIDLSEKAIKSLNGRLIKLDHAEARAVDFLSSDFKEKDFDLIYAYGVLHHFENVDELISRLKEKLSKDGEIVSHDPLQTSFPIKVVRTIYRPFQSDRHWEWPFSKKTYYKFEQAFNIKERRAVLGKAKWSAMFGILPISEENKIDRAKKWHQEDWENSRDSDAHMFKCMHLSMLMKNK